MEIKKIYIRSAIAAFNNAAAKGFDCKDTHMYMYTKTGNGTSYDVFKDILTRHHEIVFLNA